MIEDLEYRRVSAMLVSESMLPRVEELVSLPDTLNPDSDHSCSQLAHDFKEGYWADLIQIVDPRLLWK